MAKESYLIYSGKCSENWTMKCQVEIPGSWTGPGERAKGLLEKCSKVWVSNSESQALKEKYQSPLLSCNGIGKKKASSGLTLLHGHVGIVTALTLVPTSIGKLTPKSTSKHRVPSALWKNSFHKGETKVAISLDSASQMIHKADALSSVSLYLAFPEFLYGPEFDPKHSHVDSPRENDCRA